jgi:hypothetical protein
MTAWPDSLDGPFTRAQGLRAGLTEWDLRSARCRRVFAGVYVNAATRLTVEARARAALLLAPEGTAIARRTAAALWGGVVPPWTETQLFLAPGTRLRVAGVDARVRADRDIAWRRGLPLTSPARTFVDLAAELGLVDLVVLGDSLVRRGVVTPEALIRASGGRSPRQRFARRAASLVRTGVDSPMETRVRLLIVLSGLPEPVVNVVFRDEHGAWLARLDLAYPQWRIAVEYDGRQHAESSDQWHTDIGRREALDGIGWRLVVVVASDVYTRPGATIARIAGVIAERSGRRPRLTDAWREHFPQRD